MFFDNCFVEIVQNLAGALRVGVCTNDYYKTIKYQLHHPELVFSQNDEQFQKYKHGTLVVTDPHAFNAFKNHYPKVTGNEYVVLHYTQ